MSTDEDDLGSPSKKPRMETMSCTVSYPSSATPHAAATVIATTTVSPPPRLVSTTSPCAVSKNTPPCLEVAQKDSIIAQILAGTESEYGEPPFCPPGVYFDGESCYPSTTSGETAVSFGSHNSWVREPALQPAVMSGVAKETRSLLVSMESRSCSLQHSIEQVVTDHELVTCTTTEAVHLCNEQVFQLIWLQLPCPPSEDILAVITGIRYSSKLNRKTIQLGVTVAQPEIDLNLHGIDEILLEPVSRSTIRQKYFDWTSVKLAPDYELSLRDTPMSPTTPDSSISTESTIELSLSSLTSDTTNDSGIHGEIDVVDLKPPTPFLFPHQQGSTPKQPRPKHSNGRPSTPPSWCRVEHATKEKHRRERIKDSCDQLRVLLPYVRGRKTDMASILEMTVDYLKIVNSNLPHEFHAHVLDVMTKGSGSPPARPPRTPVMCGRGPRGGRGRAGRRSSTPSTSSTASPTRSLGLQDCSSQSRLATRAVSHGVMSSPVSLVSRASGNGGTRGSKLCRRSLQPSVMMSPASQSLSSLYLLDGKERGSGCREDTVLSSTMTLPTYFPPSHYTTPSPLFHDTSPSPTSSSALSHPFPSAHGLGASLTPSSSSSSDCGSGLAAAVPRLYASAHLTVEPGFLSHGPLGNPPPPPPLTTPLGARYTLGGERDGSGAGSQSFGELSGGPPQPPPPPPPAYFHYFSTNLPDLSPAYTTAGAGGGGGGGLGALPLGGGGGMGEFMTCSGLHPLTTNSAFASPPPPPPPLLQVAPSRGGGGGKGEATSAQSGGLENGSGESSGAVYTLMETPSKTPK